MNILIISSIYRCSEKFISIIPGLTGFNIDILYIGEMSPLSNWIGNFDLRQPFYNLCSKYCRNFVGPSREQVLDVYKNGSKLLHNIDPTIYDIVILDDNLCKESWGFQSIYSYIKKHKNIPIVGSPHGNRELSEKFITKNIGKCFDYSFVFGKKERKSFGKDRKVYKKLIPAGIPSNDCLKEYKNTSKYILVIVGFVKGIKLQKGYEYFTEKTFEKSGVLNLQQKYQCPIIVKEKSTFVKGQISLSSLTKYKNVDVVMDVEDDNSLVSGAKFVVGAPSTLCFKSIQLGIPTVILKGYGMLGNFIDFNGLCSLSSKQIAVSIEKEMINGKQEEWINNTLSGGLDFSSSNIYINNINKICGK